MDRQPDPTRPEDQTGAVRLAGLLRAGCAAMARATVGWPARIRNAEHQTGSKLMPLRCCKAAEGPIRWETYGGGEGHGPGGQAACGIGWSHCPGRLSFGQKVRLGWESQGCGGQLALAGDSQHREGWC